MIFTPGASPVSLALALTVVGTDGAFMRDHSNLMDAASNRCGSGQLKRPTLWGKFDLTTIKSNMYIYVQIVVSNKLCGNRSRSFAEFNFGTHFDREIPLSK